MKIHLKYFSQKKKNVNKENLLVKKRKANNNVEEDYDYHGNFDSVMFEKWFEDLCINVKKTYGPSIFLWCSRSTIFGCSDLLFVSAESFGSLR